jgi:hypothetical protein
MDDVVLSWGVATPEVATVCRAQNIPHIVMVRWWRNVAPLPPGDLMSREIPESFRDEKKQIFDEAFYVIANNLYTAGVVQYHYGRICKVSYVPVWGTIKGAGNPHGPIVLVTDAKDLGESELLFDLADLLPKRVFLVVNSADPEQYSDRTNIETTDYITEMETIWRSAGILIYPNYKNDVCGTSRVAPEAMQFGIPCLANDRAGICEKGMISMPRDAAVKHWAITIEKIYRNYQAFSDRMIRTFENYDTPGELQVYQDVIQSAFDSKQ